MKEKINLKNIHILIIFVGIIFVNLSIFHSNLWFDESYSVGMANNNFLDIWKIGSHDVHPVLYYWILHIISIFTGNSILALRIFSGFIISLTGILGFSHIRKDFGEKTGLIFSFLIYFSPVNSVYANEIRMYSLTMFLITILGIYAYRLAKESKISYWIIFGFASLCSIYTHYYGLMAAGIINVILFIYFIKKKNKKAYITQIILGIFQGVLYLPWLIHLLVQLNSVSKGFWIEVKFPKSLIEILGFTFSGDLEFYIGAIISIVICIYIVYLFIKSREIKENLPAIFAILVYGLVIFAAWIISKKMNSDILYYRYIFVITGISIFALSFMLAKGNDKYTFIICIIILTVSIFNNISMVKENYSKSNLEPIKYIKDNIKEGDIITYPDIGSGSVIAMNFPNYTKYFYNEGNWGVEEAYKAFGKQMKTYVNKDFLENCKGRCWIVTSGGTDFYEECFENEDYKLIMNKSFQTAYKEYYYKIYLVEYIGK